MADKDIKEIKECPKCGSNFGYYQKFYVSGWVSDNTLFEDGQKYNYNMYDSLNYSRPSKYYFCMECHKRIAKVKE